MPKHERAIKGSKKVYLSSSIREWLCASAFEWRASQRQALDCRHPRASVGSPIVSSMVSPIVSSVVSSTVYPIVYSTVYPTVSSTVSPIVPPTVSPIAPRSGMRFTGDRAANLIAIRRRPMIRPIKGNRWSARHLVAELGKLAVSIIERDSLEVLIGRDTHRTREVLISHKLPYKIIILFLETNRA